MTEIKAAEEFLVKRSQERSFPEELKNLKAKPSKGIAPRSRILMLRPQLDVNGVLRMGGRLNQTDLPPHQKNPIILLAKDTFTRILFQHYHVLLGHCGPSTLLAHAANLYHVSGGRKLSRSICNECITCRKAAARTSTQLLGQLPPSRVEPPSISEHRHGFRWSISNEKRTHQKASYYSILFSCVHMLCHKSCSSRSGIRFEHTSISSSHGSICQQKRTATPSP